MSGFSARQITPIVGLVLGLALGLVYTWVIAPVESVNTYPALLRTDYRWDWVRLAALSYVADGDLERAHARLDGLEHNDVAEAMQLLIEEYAAAGHPADTLRSLTTLAEALDVHTPAMLVYLHTPASLPPGSTSTPTPTPPFSPPTWGGTPTHTSTPHTPSPPTIPTPGPTHAPTPTPYPSSPLPTPAPAPTSTPPSPTPTPPLLARLQLTQQEQICRPEQAVHIEVVVRDEHGAGVAGVVIWLTWPGGVDRAVTGLKPQYGAGYVDFNAKPGVPGSVDYALGIGELRMPLVTGLRIEPCPAQEDGELPMGSWRIVLEPQPQ